MGVSIIQKSQTMKTFLFHTVELELSLKIWFQLIRRENRIQGQEGRFGLSPLQKGFLASGRWSCLPGGTTGTGALGEQVSEPQMVVGQEVSTSQGFPSLSVL